MDNRNIVDDGKSQKLTRDDIEMLKEQGLKGQVHPLSSYFLLNRSQIWKWWNPVDFYFCEAKANLMIWAFVDSNYTR